MLTRKNGIALWQQIAQQVAAEIASGRYPPGARLPTEGALAKTFGVSRNTLRRAMAKLEEDGLLRVGQGQGTFVCKDVIDYRISRKTRFSENLLREGREPATEVLTVDEGRAEGVVAECLALTTGTPLVVVQATSSADDVVLTVGTAYYPCALFPDLLSRRLEYPSQTKLLAAYGIYQYRRLTTWITTRPPSDQEARALRIPRSRWVLFTRKVDTDPDGRPICCSETCWASDRVQFVIDHRDYAASHEGERD